MTCNRSRLAWALAFTASVLVAGCGGGSTRMGIDGTGNTDGPIVSYGRLQSFGSVEINGVHYDTANATFVVDGAAASEASIGLGDIVFVEGRIVSGATRGVAQRVVSDRVLQGRVELLDVGGGLLVALGQTILIDAETQIDPSIVGGLQSLATVDAVSVSGFRDVRGAIVATRIARQTASTVAFKTTGAVTSIDTATRLLTINGLVVDYGSAALLPAGAANPLATGVFVEVKLTPPPELTGIYTATSVEVRRQRVQGSVGVRADVEGYVTSTGASTAQAFNVDGLPVVTTGSTAFSGAVSTDKRVMVSGAVAADGAVVASSFNGRNRAPVSADTSVTTTEDVELTGMLPAATDPDGDAVTYGSYEWPQNGTLQVNMNGSYSYKPRPNFSGSDRFVFRVSDGRGGHNTYTVSVTVEFANDDAPLRAGPPLAVTLGEGVASIDTFGADGARGDLALQADDRILVTGLCDICPVVKRFLADGTPDTSFGNGGEARVGGLGNTYAVAVGSNGKIVIAGASAGGGPIDAHWNFALARLNVNGSTDGAPTTTQISPSHNEAFALALLPDGRALARGYRYVYSGGQHIEVDYPIVRYNLDGSLDLSFGGGDGIITPRGSFATLKGSFAPLPDGRILVAEPRSDSHPIATLRRYQADGVTPDVGFGGGDGSVELAFDASMNLQPDGRIVLVGCSANGALQLQRLNADGTPDGGFGGGGGLVTAPVGSRSDCINQVVVQPDGRILAASSRQSGWGTEAVLVRFLADGTLDAGFGGGAGVVTLSTGTPPNNFESELLIAVQSDGRIVVARAAYRDGFPHMYLMRLLPDGRQDLDFGTRNPLRAGQPFSRTIPAETFTDPDGDPLTYTASLADGSPLPAWLHFDGATFSGTPPLGAATLYIKVTATDPSGRSGSDTFGLRIVP